MQTFVPYESFKECARCLDYQRLGKQRVECLQILNALNNKTKGWVNHPATKMWKGYENALIVYGVTCCLEWINRGYFDTCGEKMIKFYDENKPFVLPPWWGGEIHASHRSQLLKKKYFFYSKYEWPEVPGKIEYFWPGNQNATETPKDTTPT